MKRRQVLAIVGTGVAGAAGVGYVASTSDDGAAASDATPTATPTATRSPTRTDAPTQTDTATDTASPTESDTPTETATPAFNPVIYYDSCTQISVQADQYDRVTLYFENAIQQFDAGYQGTQQFAGTGEHDGKIVYEAAVELGQQETGRANPEIEACTTTPSPTATESPSPTQTPYEQSEDRRNMEIQNSRMDYYDDAYRVEATVFNGNNHSVYCRLQVEYLDSFGDVVARKTDEWRAESNIRYKRETAYDGSDGGADDYRLELRVS